MIDHTTNLDKQLKILRKRSIFTLFLTWLALFFTIVGIAAGYKNFLRVHDKAKSAQDDAKVAMALMPQMAGKVAIENWQRDIRTQLAENQAQATKELSELKSLKASNQYIETALKQQVEQLTRQQQQVSQENRAITPSGQQWQVAEIRYLLNIANRHLTLNQDAATAIGALKAADKALMVLGQPNLLALRGLIAKDIANLEGYKTIDLAAVIMAIDDLAEKLAPQITSPNDKNTEVASVARTADKTDSILNRIKLRLDETVVIKRYDNKLAKTIKGDTQQVRYELIRLKLETLKLLALKSQKAAYQTQLKQLRTLLNQEHIGLLNNAALAALGRLESMALSPKVPNLLAGQLLEELLIGFAKEQP
ncbi:MAG: uroporphyrinogen-III C-methyltransferase [Leucothrix sp.]